METNQYMDMFLDESHEHLQQLNDGLLSLEDNMEDLSVINDIFRNAHTLKGMSATMGYTKIAELTHEMEDVLDMLRHEQLKLTEEIIDILFKCLDSLEQMVDNVGNGDPEDLIDVSDLVASLSAILKGESPTAAAPAAAAPAAAAAAAPAAAAAGGIELSDLDKSVIKGAQESGLRGLYVKVSLAESCLLKSARSYMVMNALDELGEVVKTVPSAEDIEQEKFERSFELIIVTAAEEKAVSDAVLSISEVESAEVKIVDLDAPPPAPAAPAPAPVAAAPAPAAPAAAAAAAPAPAAKSAAPAKAAAA
ncbi:MAG: Hpt domain-containing protein, partial [Selenomonadaceae bacterium]|nr:Hpt domain-containing protein [Selenomonadaceae bacterium]